MDNWYQVGEQVLLVSKSQPQHNGEYVIKEILRDKFFDVTKNIEEVSVAVDLGFIGDKGNNYWDIESIRKKHKGSDKRYNEIIKSLNVDIVEVA